MIGECCETLKNASNHAQTCTNLTVAYKFKLEYAIWIYGYMDM